MEWNFLYFLTVHDSSKLLYAFIVMIGKDHHALTINLSNDMQYKSKIYIF